MKIFIVARGWPSESEPQWGSFERDQALALSKLGHQVVVLSVDKRFRKYQRKYGITCEVHEGIPHYNLFAGSLWGWALRRFSIYYYIKVSRFFFMYLLKVRAIALVLGFSSIICWGRKRVIATGLVIASN